MTRASIDAILAAAIATGKVFDPAATFVRPVLTGPAGDPALPASYTYPAGAGFAPVAIGTWGAVETLDDGRSARAGPALTFVPANAGEACVVAGAVLVDSATPTVVKEYIPAPQPVTLADERHPLTILVRLAMGENASFDKTEWIDG